MRAPGYWRNPPEAPGLLAHLLAPLAVLYAAGTARRLRAGAGSAYRAGCPLICVGNLNAGGTGKTPTVIALAQHLGQPDRPVHIVTRGHGGRLGTAATGGPVRVNERIHAAADVGDEPLLLSSFAPVWVARDRAAGVRAAEAAGAGLVILDDGFQNPSVHKDVAIIVVDAALGFGNGRVLPAGPLREPVHIGLARADLLLSIGTDAAQARFTARWGTAASGVPRIAARLEPLQTGMPWQGLRVLAFAGIGYPEKFFASLRALGADILRAEALDDHQPLTDALMARLDLQAHALGAQLVTTEKDAVRLPQRFRRHVLTLPVRLNAADWEPLDRLLAR